MKNSIWKYRNKNPLSKETPATFENEMIKYVFDTLSENNVLYEKKCIEFGASDGLFLSNTRSLVLDGWKSIQIESDGDKFNSLKNNYSGNDNVVCINCLVDEHGENSLDNIIQRTWGDCRVSVISIDVDGKDFSIMKSIVDYKPILFLVECNAHLPDYRNEGITTIYNWAKQNKYELLGYTGNLILIDETYLEVLQLDVVDPKTSYEMFLSEYPEGKKHQETLFNTNEFYLR